jgi:hypothetical protein
MSVTVTAQRMSRNTYLVTWVSTLATPTYYIWQDGRLIETTTRQFRQFTVADNQSIDVNVYDDATTPGVGYPSTFRLEWDAISGSALYQIWQYIDSVWTQIGTILDGGASHYWWESGVLDDCTDHQFRVYAISTNNIPSLARDFTARMVRRPDNPTAAYSYDPDTGYVTIA